MNESTIWVGMDVHAKTVVLAELVGESREPLVREVPNESAQAARDVLGG